MTAHRANRWRATVAVLLLVLGFARSGFAAPSQAVVFTIDGAIGPATAGYLVRGIEAVRPAETGAIILRIDTPGGLDSSMREIIRAILASPVPVIAYVAPSGARAASAGTYITYACALAAMAPGTNLGAATPVPLPGLGPMPGAQPPANGGKDENRAEPADAESHKILNDSIAYIRGLAELNGRNADWAEEAVRGAASLSATDALRLHVVDIIASSTDDLLRQIDGRTVKVGGKAVVLATSGLHVVAVDPGWRTRFLGVITDPNIAYLLLLLGAYAIILEMSSPGAVLPGLTGTISIVLALFALNMLPIDYAGAALLLLGIALMVAEAFIGTFGVLGVGGLVAFAFGSIMMFHGTGPAYGLSLSVVIGATAVSAAFFLLVIAMLVRSIRRPVVTGREALLGARGQIVAWDGTNGRVRVNGEIWQAHSTHAVSLGSRVTVTGREGLVLIVEPERPQQGE